MQKHFQFLIVAVVVVNLSIVFHAGLSSNNNAFACSCVAPQTPSIALLESRAVFSGEVTEVRTLTDVYQKIVTINVDRIWKGAISSERTRLVTSVDTGGCGFPFEEGRNYLVYAHEGSSEEFFEVSLCSRTTPIEEAQADLASLGTGYVPMHNNDGGSRMVESYGVPAIIGIGAAIASVIAFLTLRRRK